MCFEIESFIRGDEIFVRRSTAERCAELGAEKRERDNPRALRLFWRGSTCFHEFIKEVYKRSTGVNACEDEAVARCARVKQWCG
jgi:hypothetical protein